MAEFNLPEGYSLEKVEFIYARNEEGKIVLALPTEQCSPQRIEEVIKRIKRAKRTEP